MPAVLVHGVPDTHRLGEQLTTGFSGDGLRAMAQGYGIPADYSAASAEFIDDHMKDCIRRARADAGVRLTPTYRAPDASTLAAGRDLRPHDCKDPSGPTASRPASKGFTVIRKLLNATNRTLAYVALGSVAVIVGLQFVIFAIWGDDGDPPAAVVGIGFVLFFGSILMLLTVGILAVRRYRATHGASS